MAASYFAPLVTKPAIITSPGDYVTRGGEIVTIKQVSKRHDFGCCGAYASGAAERWHKSGRIMATSETGNDILRRA
jgi:hypothetical protein